MSERGVFAVDRGIFDHSVFAREPFTQREAWLWLIAEAAYKPRTKRAGGQVVSLKRGQLCHSVRFMADAWQWSKSRVDRFLDVIENQDMIRRESGTKTLLLTICKYDEYQRVSLPDRDNIGTDSGTRAGQERDKLEDIKNKEQETVAKATVRRHADWPEDYADQLWEIFPRKTEKKAGIDALKALYRADRVSWLEIVDGVERLFGCDPKFVPALARWVRGERWKDEQLPPPRAGPFVRKITGRSQLAAALDLGIPDEPGNAYPRLAN